MVKQLFGGFKVRLATGGAVALALMAVVSVNDDDAREHALDREAQALYQSLEVPVENLAELMPAAGPAKKDPAAADSIARLAQDAIRMMHKSDVTPEQREAYFRDVLSRELHTDLLSRVVLGKYWRRADAATRARFVSVFSDYMVHTFAKKLGGAKLERFQVGAAYHSGKKDSLVQSRVTHAGQTLAVVWRVRPVEGRYVILDVVIEGVSMALTRRQEFGTFIKGHGGDIGPLIAELQQKIS